MWCAVLHVWSERLILYIYDLVQFMAEFCTIMYSFLTVSG